MEAHIPNIRVRVIPAASRNEIVPLDRYEWRLRLTAPPVEGKANRLMVEFLAERLDVHRSQIRLLKGATSRNKIVEIRGLNESEISERLGRPPML
jgi:uncharacterized protein (TIGR00251 family)